jgi:hypothetical protein
MKIEIKNGYGEVLYTYEGRKATLGEAVKQAALQGVSLRGAMLSRADLSNLNLGNVDLREANLFEARLDRAVLFKATLRGAFLDSADLNRAVLTYADLSYANLSYAKLSYADLIQTNLLEANVHMTDFYLARMSQAQNVPYIPLACPSDGEFIAWKKVVTGQDGLLNEYLVKLKIPADARRSSATGRKCRCDKAEVLEITHIKTGQKVNSVVNHVYGIYCTYMVGKMVYPDSFNTNRWIECGKGIHFFVNKQEALHWGE